MQGLPTMLEPVLISIESPLPASMIRAYLQEQIAV
jgi:hypothetical protein